MRNIRQIATFIFIGVGMSMFSSIQTASRKFMNIRRQLTRCALFLLVAAFASGIGGQTKASLITSSFDGGTICSSCGLVYDWVGHGQSQVTVEANLAAGVFGTGWRSPDLAEVAALFNEAGVNDHTGALVGANAAGAQILVDFFGSANNFAFLQIRARFAGTGTNAVGRSRIQLFDIGACSDSGFRDPCASAFLQNDGISKTLQDGTIGSWIVRDALSGEISSVPIPAALPLFATALAGLGFAGYRRRKGKAA